MPNTFQRPSILHRSIVLLGCVLMGLLLSGCGDQPPQLDTSKVTNPVGKPGVCEHCKKKIDNVTEEHLITVRGNQYIVCDKKCEAELKDWLKKQ